MNDVREKCKDRDKSESHQCKICQMGDTKFHLVLSEINRGRMKTSILIGDGPHLAINGVNR